MSEVSQGLQPDHRHISTMCAGLVNSLKRGSLSTSLACVMLLSALCHRAGATSELPPRKDNGH